MLTLCAVLGLESSASLGKHLLGVNEIRLTSSGKSIDILGITGLHRAH